MPNWKTRPWQQQPVPGQSVLNLHEMGSHQIVLQPQVMGKGIIRNEQTWIEIPMVSLNGFFLSQGISESQIYQL